jgi:hypothetical protein
MEDPAIEKLEALAEDYSDVLSKRQKLTKREVDLKAEILKLMHQNGKTSYNHAGIHVDVIVEKEKVRVRINKAEGSEADDEPSEDDYTMPVE